MPETYDSRPDTIAHIRNVQGKMTLLIGEMQRRLLAHDKSKLEEPEKSIFDEFTPKLKDSEYGSEEYKGFLAEMKVALDHHYAANSHHPEHYPDGIRGMSLLDVIEMLVDWKAASERHATGDITKSIDMNQERFGYSDDLKAIFHNTAKELGWV